ncbi:MAG TPA: phosphoserine phosphatase SerB [Stellaceae bacterium]|nr:phosphoserine phosphatase SerB [Stellaceae bacterium]
MLPSVLTLIAPPASAGVIEETAEAVADALLSLGAEIGPVDWLASSRACDIPFAGLDPDQADAAARAAITAPIDSIAQRSTARRKRLLVADMESTIIVNEMLDELARDQGLYERVARITERAMNGEIDFAQALQERVKLFKGLPRAVLDVAGARIRFTPGAEALVSTMRAHGAVTALVSGGFRFFTERVRDAVGFDLDLANELIIEEGRITGEVRAPILGRDGKLAILKELAAKHHVPLAEAMAIGDGANDLPMIEAAGIGLAFHAKPMVRNAARARIDHNDLTAALYAQGYHVSDIIAG